MRSLSQMGLAFLFVVQLSSIGLAQSGVITTYVGPGLPGLSVQATTQPIDRPHFVASDGAGGLYVTSASQNRVYRVASDGTLSLIAGSGGGGSAATAARRLLPSSTAQMA